MTFKEAYERTGRILNISCIPSDPHSPSLLLNYLTAPDCCIFSAVLASAAVPGILNPVVLMTKTKMGTIAPFSFGHKWKDGSLRTDIPLKALNSYFNVTFSIVSQVNPHVSIFFFSSRGSVGRPVTHRRGKGWRGGFLGSALEQYLKLDMAKWLKVLRHLELLPRPLEQDWSSVFLQKFDGDITIWPKTNITELRYILSDPSEERLAKMLTVGQRCTFPKLKFVANRLRIERLVEKGRQMTRGKTTELQVEGGGDGAAREKIRKRVPHGRERAKGVEEGGGARTPTATAGSPSARFSNWLPRWNSSGSVSGRDGAMPSGENGQRNLKEEGVGAKRTGMGGRRTGLGDTLHELGNQVRLFDDDSEFTGSSTVSEEEEEEDEEKEEEGGGGVDTGINGRDREGDSSQKEEEMVEMFQAAGMGGVVGVLP